MSTEKNDYVKLTLEYRTWTSKKNGNSGEDYCLNNSTRETADVFGHKANISISKAGEKFEASSGWNVWIWFNEMTHQEAEAFKEEYGETIYIHAPTREYITVQQYDELFNTSDTVQTSQQPTQSF